MRLISRAIFAVMILTAGALLVWRPAEVRRAPAGRRVISYWEKWTGKEADQMRRIVDEFNASAGKDAGMYVEYLSISGVDRKTLTATAAGVPPEVAGLWDPQIAPFAAEKALVPIEEMARRRGITASYYKPVYWNTCFQDGHLWGLVSTPNAYALHYNKLQFYENAARLRSLGLDATRPPKSIDELDRYAAALDTFEPGTGRIDRAGYLPLEPGWAIAATPYWFAGAIFDEQARRFVIDSPPSVAAYEWIRSYSRRLGAGAMTEFRGGLGGFNSPNNPFLNGKVSMVLQGPWMANYIYTLKPEFSQVLVPWSLERFLPRVARPFNYGWGVAPFPSAVAGLNDVSAAGFDALCIPRGAGDIPAAFEFIAFINRQDVIEKLCRVHCKNSPLASVSDEFILTHPNPYIGVFERLARSPNAHGGLSVAIGPWVNEELGQLATQAALRLDELTVKQAVDYTQRRVETRWEHYLAEQARRQQ